MYTAGPFWKLPLRYPRALAYARSLIGRDPRVPWQRACDAASVGLVAAVYVAAWWYGWLFEALWLWFVPVLLAKVVMDWYINYLPHVGLPPHRYRGTRVVDVAWLTPLVLNHNYHAIHHLWPAIPWHRYRRVFRRERAQLEQHGVPIERRVFAPRFVPRGAAPAA